MMNGTVARSKTLLIKQMLNQGKSIREICRKLNVSSGYVSFIENWLDNNLSTNFYKKRFRSRNPEKRNKERNENYYIGAKYDYCSRGGYSKREDELILKFKGTDRELAKLIGRSVKGIQVRRTRIKKESLIIVENILEPVAQLQNV